MKAQDHRQAVTDERFSICAKRRTRTMRDREKVSGGWKRMDRDALSVNAVPVLYATPPPLPQGNE